MYWYYFFFVVLLVSCQSSTQKHPHAHSYQNVQWQLLAFEDTTKSFQKNTWLWVSAEFLTDKDSAFWNSNHEGADKFFLQLLDTLSHPFYYPFYFASENDSFMIIAPKEVVLKDVFNTNHCPSFLKNDKNIKCFLKIKKQINLHTDNSFLYSFQKNEEQIINHFLKKNNPLYQQDSNQIIWLEPLPIPPFKNREHIKEATVAYSGYFLDGRMIDHCDSLGIRYNDTLQLIEGLNYVIKKLNVGQSAKIILPSRLAFGMRGSFNKTIPPYTPLLYEIKLLQIQ
ncbi:MAG: FKBP-type peptidyl-prolyl cis-trans isomerase [Bacteroidia bacterium]|nr:FKBP-type peptidyl-prolyl cis-trans isomerase [Bacteroidia bacterium]